MISVPPVCSNLRAEPSLGQRVQWALYYPFWMSGSYSCWGWINNSVLKQRKDLFRLWSLVRYIAHSKSTVFWTNIYALKGNFQRSSHRVHFTYDCGLLSVSAQALDAQPPLQPCYNNHVYYADQTEMEMIIQCAFIQLWAFTQWALYHHFDFLGRMIILWKSGLFVKSKVSDSFMICLPLIVTLFWSCMTGQGNKWGACFKLWCKEQLCTSDNFLLSKEQEKMFTTDTQSWFTNPNVPGWIGFTSKHS